MASLVPARLNMNPIQQFPKIGDRVRVCVNGCRRSGNLCDGYYPRRRARIEPGTWKVKGIYSDGRLYCVQRDCSWDFVKSWIKT